MKLKLNRDLFFRIATIAAVVITIIVAILAINNGRQYFRRRNILQLVNQIKNFGIWSPFIVSGFIVATVLVPFIPIPTTIVEIVTGSVFGFWPGFILIWLTQILTATISYYSFRFLSRTFFRKLTQSSFFNFYRQIIEKHGVFAIFVVRATMISPFNISYLASLLNMPFSKFITATALGAVSESAIFTYIGTLVIQRIHFRLWYVLAMVVILSLLPSIILLVYKNFSPRKSVTA